MDYNTLELKDGTQLMLEPASSLGDVRLRFSDKAALVAGWDKLTGANLSTVKRKNGEDVVGTYENLAVGDPAIRAVYDRADGLTAAFNLREKTEVEKLADRMAAVEDTTVMLTIDALGGGKTA